MDTLVDDVGSFPLPVEVDRESFSKAYQLAREAMLQGKDISKDDYLRNNFCSIVLDSFKTKIVSGLDVVNFPQQYDGVKQVGDTVHAAMEKGSFLVEEKNAVLPEVYLINQNAKALSEEFGKKIQLRVSIFGPLELYLHEIGKTPYHDVLDALAETIKRFAKNSILNNKYIETKVVSIDEPSFGFNNIQTTPDVICTVLEKAFDFKGATRQIHLHSAAGVHDLLCVKNLDVLSFEYAASPINIEAVPKSMLEKANKQIRIGISRTDIDSILAELYQKGITKPLAEQLVESEETIRKRFRFAKKKYGDQMTFTGPDCGLGGWPSQKAAQLLLEQTVKAVKAATTRPA
jgi:5-methyltetrahydropteroyltriglutamate--homocysteine methyltransferase